MSYFDSLDSAIGNSLGTDLILGYSGKDDKGKTLVRVRCTLCGKERDLQWSRFNYGTARKCDCKAPKGNKIHIGDTFGTDIIIEESNRNTRPAWVLECTLCDMKRVVEKHKFGSNRVGKCSCSRYSSDRYKEQYKGLIGKIDKKLGIQILNILTPIEANKTDRTAGIQLHVKCSNCGREYNIRASHYIKNESVTRCICDPRSQPHNTYSGEELHKILRDKYRDTIGKIRGKLEVIDVLNGEHGTLCRCICNCNKNTQNIIDIPLAEFNTGRILSCGCVGASYGERVIEQILDSMHIDYSREVSFEDLKSPRNYSLRYDFIVRGAQDQRVLIEYNGSQHYSKESFKYNEQYTFEYRQLCDKLKMDYAKANNIPLLVINNIKDINEIKQEVLSFLHSESII